MRLAPDFGRVTAVFIAAVIGITAFVAVPVSAREPTEQEQFFVELINRARQDPDAEVVRLGTGSLNEGPPMLGPDPWTIVSGRRQPVAFNLDLVDAASDYATLLNDNDEFCHDCLGTTPEDRMTTAGYVPMVIDFFSGVAAYTGLYGVSSPNSFVPGRENLSFYGEGPSNGMIDDMTLRVSEAHTGLFNDFTVPGRGHRSTMMYGEFQEVGVGISVGTDPGMTTTLDSMYITTDFAFRSDRGPFITGVAYDDVDDDGFYTPDNGEALGGLTVTATATVGGATFMTTTFASGGYSLEVDPSTIYDVRFTGTGIDHTVPFVPLINDPGTMLPENVKVDFVLPEPATAALQLAVFGTLGALARRRRAA